ncbi:MAG: hypothetical protein ACOY0T_20195 [Myxococcota bacterium]
MFDDRLQVTLTLNIGSSTFSAAAGAVESIELEAWVFGFEATVAFRVSSEGETDGLFDDFLKADVMKATLALANGRLGLEGEVPEVSTWIGYVTERGVRETTSPDLTGMPIIERLYTVRFADAARVFWREHRPLSVYAGKSYKDVFDANLVQGVTLEYDSSALEQAYDVIAVGLGAGAGASFYDYVCAVISDSVGVIEFDGASSSYRLGKDKSAADSSLELDAGCVEALDIVLPSPARHATRVLNPFSEATAKSKDVANESAGQGVRRDVVAYTPIPKEMDQRATLEADRLRASQHQVAIRLQRLLPVIAAPNSSVKIGDSFSPRIHAAGKTYRVVRSVLKAGPPSVDSDAAFDLDAQTKRFGLELTLDCEASSNPTPVLPKFEAAKYPFFAEGKILSASGAETDRTWYAMAETDAVVRYRVYVPLWNVTVVVPFLPTGESGHFFFPAYKNQRVLLAFDAESARIVTFLDWASKLASETQGNQLVMGKRVSSGTVMKHVYADDSPIFTLVRTQSGDTQSVELSEGRIFLEVKAEESEQPATQSYDLTPQAEVAKESASAQARSSISDLTGSYQNSMATASSALNGASSELEDGVGSAATRLSAKADTIEAELAQQAAELDALSDGLDQKVAAAKAQLDAALEE